MRLRVAAMNVIRIRHVLRVLREPLLDLFDSNLGVELDSPRVSDAERLRADTAAGQLHGACRERMRVVVPLERVESLGQGRRNGIGSSGVGELDRIPADLRLGRAEDVGAGRPRDELRAEADAEQRRAVLEQPFEPPQLGAQPAVPLLLVGVHRAAEDDHGVGAFGRLAAELHRPLDELVTAVLDRVREDARADARTVGDGEDLHTAECSDGGRPTASLQSGAWTRGPSACSTPASVD